MTGPGKGWVWQGPNNTSMGLETSRQGVANHGPTMESLTTGSRENALNSGTAVRCLQGVRVDPEAPGSMA